MEKQIKQSQWNALTGQSADAAFSEIYEQTSHAVWTLCFRILKSEEDASDALQGTYARLLQLVHQESQPPQDHSMDTLMLRLAVLESDRLRKQRGRRQNKEVAVEQFDQIDQKSPSLEDLLAQQQLREKLTQLIDQLPENLRLPIVLHYIDGLTQTQIAASMGVSQSVISDRLKKALNLLRPKCRKAGLQELTTVLTATAGLQTLLAPPSAMAATTVLSSAIQISQSAGFASLPLSALMPAKGAVLGGKALLATVASLVVIVSITLATTVGGEKEQNHQGNTIKGTQTTQQDQSGIDSHNSTDRAVNNTNESKTGSPNSNQQPSNKPAMTTDIDPAIKVVWQGTNEPVEGATLLLIDSETKETSNSEGIIPLTQILEDGGSEVGRKLRLTHPKAVTRTGKVPREFEEPVIIELQKAGVLTGTLAFEESGKLADNETIKLYQNVLAYDNNIKLQETTTNDKGQYQFHITDPGKARIRATNKVYIDVTEYGQRLEMNLFAGEDAEAPLLLLKQGASIYGKVTDERGQPIKGVEFYQEGNPDLMGLSGINGEYTLSPLPPRGYSIEIIHREYVPANFYLTLDDKEKKELPVTLKPGYKLQLTVLDSEDHQPIDDFRIYHILQSGGLVRSHPESTGEPGVCLINGISKQGSTRLSFSSPFYEYSDLSITYPEDSDFEKKTVYLERNNRPKSPPTVYFSGNVYSSNNTPIERATITYSDGYNMKSSAITDKNGAYILRTEFLENGFLRVSAEGYGTEVIEKPIVGTMEETGKNDLTLSPGHELNLIVKDDQGTLMPEARVRVYQILDTNNKNATIDANPYHPPQPAKITHTFKDLPDIPLQVSAYAHGYTAHYQRVSVNNLYEITLHPDYVILGEVVDAENKTPIDNFTIKLKGNGLRSARINLGETFMKANGVFALRGLNQIRPYSLVVDSKGYSTAIIENIIATSPNDETFVRVELSKNKGEQLMVVDSETNQPLAGIPVIIKSRNNNSVMWDKIYDYAKTQATDSNGYIPVNLQGGDAMLVIPPYGNYSRQVAHWKDLNGTENIKTLPLYPGCTLTVTLSPVIKDTFTKISLSSAKSPSPTGDYFAQTTVDQNGKATWQNLLPGVYKIGPENEGLSYSCCYFRKEISIETHGETKNIILGETLGNSHLFGRLTVGREPVPKEIILAWAKFSTGKIKTFMVPTDNEGYFHFKTLENGKYGLSTSFKNELTHHLTIRPDTTVVVSGETEFNWNIKPTGKITVSFDGNSDLIPPGYTLNSVVGYKNNARPLPFQCTYMSRQTINDDWETVESANGEYVFTLFFEKGDESLPIKLSNQPVHIDNSRGPVDLGILSIPNSKSVLGQ